MYIFLNNNLYCGYSETCFVSIGKETDLELDYYNYSNYTEVSTNRSRVRVSVEADRLVLQGDRIDHDDVMSPLVIA